MKCGYSKVGLQYSVDTVQCEYSTCSVNAVHSIQNNSNIMQSWYIDNIPAIRAKLLITFFDVSIINETYACDWGNCILYRNSCTGTRRCKGRIGPYAIHFWGNIYAWYPSWFIIFKSGIHDTPFIGLLIMMHNIYVWFHEKQYLWMVSMVHHIYARFPWYTIFRSGIHYAQYMLLVSMMHNIYVCYPRYAIFMFGPRVWLYVL